MKINRNDLKVIIKECIVEVLTDGVGEHLIESMKNTGRQRRDRVDNVNEMKMVPLVPSRQSPSQKPRNAQSNALSAAINEVAGKDDVMKNILADTAATTLPQMLQNDKPGTYQPTGNSIEERIVEAAEPQDIFGSDNVDRWASLAFETHRPGVK